jgi:rubrerythrin
MTPAELAYTIKDDYHDKGWDDEEVIALITAARDEWQRDAIIGADEEWRNLLAKRVEEETERHTIEGFLPDPSSEEFKRIKMIRDRLRDPLEMRGTMESAIRSAIYQLDGLLSRLAQPPSPAAPAKCAKCGCTGNVSCGRTPDNETDCRLYECGLCRCCMGKQTGSAEPKPEAPASEMIDETWDLIIDGLSEAAKEYGIFTKLYYSETARAAMKLRALLARSPHAEYAEHWQKLAEGHLEASTEYKDRAEAAEKELTELKEQWPTVYIVNGSLDYSVRGNKQSIEIVRGWMLAEAERDRLKAELDTKDYRYKCDLCGETWIRGSPMTECPACGTSGIDEIRRLREDTEALREKVKLYHKEWNWKQHHQTSPNCPICALILRTKGDES